VEESSIVDEELQHTLSRFLSIEGEILEGEDLVLIGQEEGLDLAHQQSIV
jgi:hypothetical protein